jgi:hypothetical protein
MSEIWQACAPAMAAELIARVPLGRRRRATLRKLSTKFEYHRLVIIRTMRNCLKELP